MIWSRICAVAAALASCLAAVASLLHTPPDLHQQFIHPPADSRIMMRWWWFGPAVAHQELARELHLMKDAGIGGVEIQPVYPLQLLNNQPYLSTNFLDSLHFAADKARELGLRVDITLGSGWPFGGPHINVTQAAGRLRIEHSAQSPALEDGEKLIVAFPEKQLYFISSRTGQQVKRAGVGAEGFVLDPYDKHAIENHLHSVGDKLLFAFGLHPPYAVFSDSLEVYGSDWTSDFLAEFKKRRGYDLKPHLAELLDSPDIRHDWALTLCDLAEENYLIPIAGWAHAHHTRFRSQTYGEPPVRLSSGSIPDLAEGEMGPQWREFSTTRWAASTNHLYGRNVTSSETWTWLHSPAFRATPLDLKAEADLHFIQGINQLIGHGWPYSPTNADESHSGEPGQRFYAAAALNEHNPWFLVMPDITSYLQRVSFILRQGKPVTDVAVYLPTDDALAACKPGHVSVDGDMKALLGATLIPQILDSGFNFDYLDDAAIAKVDLPYKIVILPGVERISVETLKRLKLFIDRGGKVVATRYLPSLAPGYADRNYSALVLSLSKILKMIRVPDETQLGSELKKLAPPDLETNSSAIAFIHRKTENRDFYFVVNTSNSTVQTSARFASTGASEEWDLFSDKISGFNASALKLAPYESKLIVFGGKPLPNQISTENAVVADLSSNWSVRFPNTQSTLMPVLKSWTDDNSTKFFSGRATYSRTFEMNGAIAPLWLDFGEGEKVATAANGPGMRALLESPVRECALVYLNGNLAGSVWHPPFRLDVSSLVHSGVNKLEVIVANTAINQIAGTALPSYKLLNLRYGERFTPQGFENLHAVTSGLLGPVRLLQGR